MEHLHHMTKMRIESLRENKKSSLKFFSDTVSTSYSAAWCKGTFIVPYTFKGPPSPKSHYGRFFKFILNLFIV